MTSVRILVFIQRNVESPISRALRQFRSEGIILSSNWAWEMNIWCFWNWRNMFQNWTNMSSTLENDARGMRGVVTLHHFGNFSDCSSIDHISHRRLNMARIWLQFHFLGRLLFYTVSGFTKNKCMWVYLKVFFLQNNQMWAIFTFWPIDRKNKKRLLWQ